MKEIHSLIARARKYLKSAGLLLREEDFESSVSRSYYAMFYAAEAALLSKGLAFSSHRGVVAGFSEHFVVCGLLPREMGRALHLAFEMRQLGDYEYTFVISRDEARTVLESASDFVDRVANYLASIEEVGAE